MSIEMIKDEIGSFALLEPDDYRNKTEKHEKINVTEQF